MVDASTSDSEAENEIIVIHFGVVYIAHTQFTESKEIYYFRSEKLTKCQVYWSKFGSNTCNILLKSIWINKIGLKLRSKMFIKVSCMNTS